MSARKRTRQKCKRCRKELPGRMGGYCLDCMAHFDRDRRKRTDRP